MFKEAIISIIAVSLIIWGNNLTYDYAKEAIEVVTNKLEETKSIINKDNKEINNKDAKTKINEIHEFWDTKHKSLAYFIEHDELEKVELILTQIRTNIEIKKYEDATVEIDKSIYILRHIQNKIDLKLENIL